MKRKILFLLIIVAVLLVIVESGKNKRRKIKQSQRQCPTGCRKCTNTTCIKCLRGFKLSQETKQCEKKRACALNCAACSDDGECTKCKRKFALWVPRKQGRSPKCIPCAKVAKKSVKFDAADTSRCKVKKVGSKRKGKKNGRKGGKGNRKPTETPAITGARP